MIDHVSVRVSDLPRALEFYRAALAPLGYHVVMEFPGMAGLGAGGKPDFWLTHSDRPINPTHVAIATDRASAAAFHSAGLAAGGRDDGAPGPRAEYHPHYFAAYLLDPDGNNIEAVSHARPGDAPAKKAPTKRAAGKPATAKPATAKKAAAKKAAAKQPAKRKPAKHKAGTKAKR